MKLTIVDELSKQEISLELLVDYELNNDYEQCFFYENRKYTFFTEIDSLEIYDQIRVYVGDIQINSQIKDGKVVCLSDYFFIDCFDITNIKVEKLIDDESYVYCTRNIRIAVPKVTSEYIKGMLEDIENNYSNIIDSCFAKSSRMVGVDNGLNSGFNSTMLLLDEVYSVYNEMLPFFQTNISKSISDSRMINGNLDFKNLDINSINWIMQHPENIEETDKNSPIVINNKRYCIRQADSIVKKETYEIYENKCVLGFLLNIITYITEMENIGGQKLRECEKGVPASVLKDLPQDYEIAYNCVVFYYKEILKRMNVYKGLFCELYDAYSHCFKFDTGIISEIPRYTFIFRQKHHYNKCFEVIVKWFEAGRYNLTTFSYLLRMKKISKIFEFYTLLKIQNGILNNNFRLRKMGFLKYQGSDNSVNNYYEFVNTSNLLEKIELYYEPWIYDDKIENGIELYSLGYKFLECMKKARHWTPDFVLKITIDERVSYFILDSKFSKFTTVKNHRLVDLANKYILGICSLNKTKSDVLGLWAIIPGVEDESETYENKKIETRKQNLPIVGIRSLLKESDVLGQLVYQMVNISKMIDE